MFQSDYNVQYLMLNVYFKIVFLQYTSQKVQVVQKVILEFFI